MTDGSTDKAAYEAEGIHASTFYEWIETKPEFSEAVTRARAKAELNYTLVVKEAAKAGDVNAALQWLARRRRDEWAVNIRQEVSGPGGGPIPIREVIVERPTE